MRSTGFEEHPNHLDGHDEESQHHRISRGDHNSEAVSGHRRGNATSTASSSSAKPNGPLAKAVTQFLRSLGQRNASPNTVLAYTKDLASFADYIGNQKPADIDHVRIRGFLSHLYDHGLGKTSVARHLAAVRSFYKWLAREGLVKQNPAALVSTPK